MRANIRQTWPKSLPVGPWLVVFSSCLAYGSDPFATQRDRMVQTAIIDAGIRNTRVIEAVRQTARHEFVSRRQQPYAYYDMAMPIGNGQTISPPYVVAFMTEQLDPQPADKVLEIGTGSGYQAAVLSGLVDHVYTIEIVEPLGRKAARTMKRLGYQNVSTKVGDGYQGWPEHAPFDKIIVTCSPENIPTPLVEQLSEGGRMVVPLGERFQQVLYLFRKVDGKLEREALHGTFFVPMTGQAEAQRRVKPDETLPELVNGSFEQTAESSQEPSGWFYVRQAQVQADPNAPDGQKCLHFSNSIPGNNAHAMQGVGVDGRKVQHIDVRLTVRGRELAAGQTDQQQAKVIVEFYGADRAPVGHDGLGPWSGSFDWKPSQARIPVPKTARLAVVGIGLFGGTGDVWFDQVQVTIDTQEPNRTR